MRTKYLPAKYRHLVEGKFPSAGPNPNIRGMKKKFYGEDSYTVMCGSYLYYLGGWLHSQNRPIWDLAK